MPYLVDGNNVMAQTPGWHRDRGKARRRLIQDLKRFVAVHKVRLTVVFDGAGDADFPEGTVFKGVRVRYARPGSDADTRIKEMVRSASFKRDVVVVTSDRKLQAYVSGKGAKIMPSGVFNRKLDDCYAAGAVEIGQDETVDVDEWLEYFRNGGK